MLPEICMAAAIYFESRSEPLHAQYAVAEVIMNRVESKRFPNNVCDVVLQKDQFSFLWDGGQDLRPKDSKAWALAEKVARDVLKRPMAYTDACHYTRKEVRRVWMKDLKRVAVYGDHKFMTGGC